MKKSTLVLRGMIIFALAVGLVNIGCTSTSTTATPASGGITTTTSFTAVADNVFSTSHINSITYGGGMFVAVGNDGKIAYSSDGVRWTLVNNSVFGTTGEIEG